MSDAPDERRAKEAPTATADGDTTGTAQSRSLSQSLGRREFLFGSGVLLAGGAGGWVATTNEESGAEQSYILRQGYLRYEVDPVRANGGEMTVDQFYDYQTEATSASPEADLIAEDAASRLLVYEGPVAASLVFLHGSPDVDHGGTAVFAFSGLSRDQGEWAVRDDPTGIDDDFDPWASGNQRVAWGWGAHKTDGGAYWGVLDRPDFTITVTPKELRGVDSWTFLTGELGDLQRYDLYQEKPVTLRPAKGKTVKRANVDIMPDAEHAEFDPYGDELITVAVHEPPTAAEDGEWVDPQALDPGNYAVNFGSKQYLAGENAAQPQQYFTKDGTLYLRYKARAANFTLDSAYGYLVSKVGEKTYVRGRDVVRPGGFDNVDRERPHLVVTDLHVDPDDDAVTLRREYVEFTNDGDESLDLTGYRVEDEAGTVFTLPDGFVLGADESVRLHTGDGDSTDTDLYWGRDEPVWNDDGDTVVVLDDAGETALEYTYPRS